MLEPLLQLRADWRRAAVDTVPSLAAQVVELLDRALDYLDQNQQLNREGLVTAVDLVTDSLADRSGEREILRSRLMAAVQDYLSLSSTSRPTRIDPAKTVFGTEDALIEALYQIAQGGTLENDPDLGTEQIRVPEPASKFDRRALEFALDDYHGRRQRLRVRTIRVVVFAGLLVAGAIYLLSNWSKLYSSPPAGGTGGALFSYRGTLNGPKTSCNQVPSSTKPNECDITVALTGSSARLDIKVTWTAGQALTTAVLDSRGNVVSSQTATGGQADVITGAVQGGQRYTFLWTASPSVPLNFSAEVYSTS